MYNNNATRCGLNITFQPWVKINIRFTIKNQPQHDFFLSFCRVYEDAPRQFGRGVSVFKGRKLIMFPFYKEKA